MTENPDDIRREIEIARSACAAAHNDPLPDLVVPAAVGDGIDRAYGAHLFGLQLRLARAEADATNNAQRKP